MKIKVLSKQQTITKDGKDKTFYRYFTYVMIDVIENGENLGQQKKSLEVHFTNDGSKSMTKKSGKIVGNEPIFAIIDGDIGLPFVYEVKVDENGNNVYPKAWIRSVSEFKEIPYEPKQSSCKPLLDEEETEPVEIVG